jgi:hypothetical protein
MATATLQYNKLKQVTETITPTKAKKILAETNVDNRSMRRTVVERYARDMANGNWRLTSDPIKFDADGRLIDGQHRLQACVEAGKSFKTAVAYGVEVIAKEAMDTGLRRTFADVLQWRGETSSTALAAAIRMGYRWQNNHVFGAQFGAFSHAEGLEWYSLNPSIRKTLSLSMRLRAHHKIPPPATSAFLHRINLIDPEQADAFIAQIDIGDGLQQKDPVFALRSWLRGQMAKQAQARLGADFYLAVMIKTWNYWAQGQELEIVSFKRGGTFKEKMPQLLDFEGAPVEMTNELTEPVSIPVPEQYRS